MEKEKVAAEPDGFAEESRVKSQEPSGCAEEDGFAEESSAFGEESRVKSQESSEEDLIYEIAEESGSSESSEESEVSEISESSEDSEGSEDSENDDNADNAENQLRKMVTEMGAETVLDIIRDNRNAAIRQILSEVEGQRTPMSTGTATTRGCNSIFDLAALA